MYPVIMVAISIFLKIYFCLYRTEYETENKVGEGWGDWERSVSQDYMLASCPQGY